MSTIITILDGYTDEPSCLGVPPYLAPLPRYIFGSIRTNSKDTTINYLTIDEYRASKRNNQSKYNNQKMLDDKIKRMERSKLLIIIAGAVVPGKYLSGNPISFRECIELADDFSGCRMIGGAAAQNGFHVGTRFKPRNQDVQKQKLKGSFDFVGTCDLDASVYDYLTEKQPIDRLRTETELKVWSVAGAELVSQHPNYPKSIMLELEAGRGCVRYCSGGCSFCNEPEFGKPEFRAPSDILREVDALGKLGITRFRLGAISCIFSYMAEGIGITEIPKPNPKMVNKLLVGIRKTVPYLQVFHLDNANPAIMAAHIKETKTILKTIVENCTGGNVLSFGLESADPKVISANNLNTNPQEVVEMIKLVNQYGSKRSITGLPVLLPGLNFVYGLGGESKETFKLNFDFLKTVLTQGLMLRRINLRQVVLKKLTSKNLSIMKKHHSLFFNHKKMVREQIDKPMLERLIPSKTVLKQALVEEHQGNITFARQIGTYPILIGIPYKISIGNFIDVLITEHGFRSVTGFSVPFNINTATEAALQSLPGIGRKRAIRILRSRPFKSISEIFSVFDDKTIIADYKNHIKL